MVSVLTPAERMHTYTIVDAITDKNVLPFRINYVNTIQVGVDVKDKKVPARAMLETCGSAGMGCTFPVIIWSLKQ